jgi:phenylalanyl-tRNA synthetase beta chain
MNTLRGLARALELLEQVSPGIRLVGGLADSRGEFKAPAPIELSIDWLQRKLGRNLNAHEVRSILESLEFGVEEPSSGHFVVTVPSWRATKDISIKDDLLEEVGRMTGYGSITPQAPLVEAVVPPESASRLYLRAVRNMAAAQGFTEVYNYSFVNEEMVRAFEMDLAEHVGVTNPIASDQSLLRASLLPAIRKNILDNSRHLQSFRLFEVGREIHAKGRDLPEEVPHFVAAIYARAADGSASLFELKRLAECLMDGCQTWPAKPRPFEHPERAAIIQWRGEDIGRLSELHPSLGIEGRAAVLDLDVAKMEKLAHHDVRYQTLRRFPVSAFDLSVVANLREASGEIERRLAAAAGSDLVAIEFVRVYTGAPLPGDRKSVSYRLTVAAPDRTLSSEEVSTIRSRVIDAMRAAGYELRV